MKANKFIQIDEYFDDLNQEPVANIDANRGQNLWKSVLIQALRDANNNMKTSQMQIEKNRARAWLTSSSKDFNMVCSFAGFDPSRCLKKFQLYFEKEDNGQ